MTERERLTTERRKIFARESLTLMSMTKEELRQHYSEIFDRLQEYEVAEENNQIIVPPCKVGDTVYYIYNNTIIEYQVNTIIIYKYSQRIVVWGRSQYFEFSDFGKTVFLTREGAEKALEEMNK